MRTPPTGGILSCPGYTTCMDTPLPPEEPELTDEERAWLAQLLEEAGPDGARLLADWLGIDL